MKSPIKSMCILLGLWLLLRVIFFEGLWGFDDLFHANFALHPKSHPANHWESRLLFNSALALSIRLFGFKEWVLALPGLIGSLAFVMASWWTGRKLWDEVTGFLSGIFACFLVLDITHASYPVANSLANGFCAVGTGMVLLADKRRSLSLIGGLLLGISIFTHLSFLFYVGIFALAVSLKEWPPLLEWRRGSLVFIIAFVGFLTLNFSLYTILTGNPLYEFSVVSKTHLPNQNFAVPLRLSSGEINPAWIWWPFINLVFSKAFGMLISLSVVMAILKWPKLEMSLRLITLTILMFWAYVSFGSQHPFRYLPLDHDTRYWYPLALPTCLLMAGILKSHVKTNRWRFGGVALIVTINIILLLLSGNWGQNVEISKELLHYANMSPDSFFVTDPYTYDEMFILQGGNPPKNIGLLIGAKASFSHLDDSYYRSPEDPNLKILYNPLQEWRPRHLVLSANAKRQEIAPPRYRMIAYLFPHSFRERFSQLIRKPAAQLITLENH